MKLSLHRIGWSMPSFTVTKDQFGVTVPLTLVSPALLKRHLRLAVVHLHERRACAKFFPALQQPVRARHDQVHAMLQSSKFTSLEKGSISALACAA
eukprot:7236655-Pyramimonas_sp.AAC.1